MRVAEKWYTAEQLCDLFDDLTVAGLANQRYRGVGPKGHRVGRRIYYAESDVQVWLESRADEARSRNALPMVSASNRIAYTAGLPAKDAGTKRGRPSAGSSDVSRSASGPNTAEAPRSATRPAKSRRSRR